jgi:hypothetical protein
MRLPLKQARGPVRAQPTLVGLALIAMVLILLWAVIIAIAMTTYSVFS